VTKYCILFFFLTFSVVLGLAQTDRDTTITKDSVPVSVVKAAADSGFKPHPKKKVRAAARPDSTSRVIALDSPRVPEAASTVNADTIASQRQMTDLRQTLISNPYFDFLGTPFTKTEDLHSERSFDSLFYLLMGILFYFAVVRFLFGKYLGNLFTLFFRVSMRQQQIREQVIQSPLPSLLLNIFFFISGGLYSCFLIQYFKLPVRVDFWSLFLNCSLILVVIYLVKFIVLKSAGWIFNIQRATDTYLFIVFMTNKILGIFLLPFLVTLSFSDSFMTESAVTLSLIMIFFFFVRRFAISYGPLRKEINLNGLHFFLYLCAFEVAPLLLIYKVLLNYLEKAY
jgi:hypothetical protein